MFKVGEKVICIDDSDDVNIQLNEIYTVKSIDGIYVKLKEKGENAGGYYKTRFISLKESRKLKLKQLEKCLK